ncbi:MAG: hypothetical protein ACI8PZ_003097 [Myxococcota bacterium]
MGLIGAWILDEFHIRYADGRPDRHPFGPDAAGLLIYTESGHVTAVLSRADRPALGASRLETASRTPAAARADAFDSYLSYAGRWRLEGDVVVHVVDWALVPDLVGQEQRRTVALDGDALVLSYTLAARSGVDRHYRLTWRRA